MTNTKRFVSILLAALMLVAMLAGCSAPKLTIGGTPDKLGTVDDTEVATGEYLAYLYSSFYNYYYTQGLYQYAQIYAQSGMDIWEQEYTYGEGDSAEKLPFDDFLKREAQDAVIRQEALRQMMAEQGITWDEEELKKVEEELKDMKEDEYLPIGISNENFIKAYKDMNLNESSLFYGLYKDGGKRAVPEAERRTYFNENYVSFKIITVALTDSQGAELNADGQKEKTDQLNTYLEQYNKSGNFDTVIDSFNAANAEEGTEVPASTDKDNRVNLDATQAADAELVKAVRGVEVGQAKVVTYKANGSSLTAALILRLDINEPATLFADETENILYGMKYEEFNKEVKEKIAKLDVKFKKSVLKDCDPRNFLG